MVERRELPPEHHEVIKYFFAEQIRRSKMDAWEKDAAPNQDLLDVGTKILEYMSEGKPLPEISPEQLLAFRKRFGGSR
ncbi:MAG: hypothetical protein ACOYT7_00900 [Patescibacteria group bacterium]